MFVSCSPPGPVLSRTSNHSQRSPVVILMMDGLLRRQVDVRPAMLRAASADQVTKSMEVLLYR